MKEEYYTSYIIDENGTIIEAIVQLLFGNILKLHDLLSSLTSDRSPQFISRV